MLIVILGLFLIAPFLKTRKSQIIIATILVVFIVLVLVFPNSILMDIKFPILNSSIYDITIDFASKSGHYGHLIEFDQGVEENTLNVVTNIIKAIMILVVLGLTLLISTLVLFITSLAKKNGKKAKVCFSTLGLIVLSFVMLLSPVYTTVNIYTSINRSMGKKNSSLLESYPQYEKYEKILKVLDTISDKVDVDLAIFDLFNYPVDALSLGGSYYLKHDMDSVDSYLLKLKNSGITIIYTDENFDFYNTKKDTFDFDKIIGLMTDVGTSKIYNDISRNYTNQILRTLEKELAVEVGKGELDLEFSKEEYASQYKDLMKLLEFVVEYDLVDRIKNISVASVLDLVAEINFKVVDMPDFSKLSVVNKIKSYLGYNTNLAAALYTCSRLYDSMNVWLAEYKQSEFYNVSYSFLQWRGIL